MWIYVHILFYIHDQMYQQGPRNPLKIDFVWVPEHTQPLVDYPKGQGS